MTDATPLEQAIADAIQEWDDAEEDMRSLWEAAPGIAAAAVLAAVAEPGPVRDEMTKAMGVQPRSQQLAALPENWNGYGESKIGEGALDVVRYLSIVPTSPGGVQIEWHASGWDVEIEMDATGMPTGFSMERAAPSLVEPSEPQWDGPDTDEPLGFAIQPGDESREEAR